MAITDWPASERPREKLLSKGATSLTDAELMAIFLRTGVRGKSAVDLARDLLHEFGSLRSILLADQTQFCSAKGLGEAKFTQLQAVLEMGRRHLQEGLSRGESFTNPAEVKQFVQAKLRDYPHEVFAVLFLDNKHRLIAFEELFTGSINSASVYPREIMRRVLKHNAAAVILAHNHPSGVAEPSSSDEHITKKINEALSLIETRLLDHLVVGDEVVSFAERGLI